MGEFPSRSDDGATRFLDDIATRFQDDLHFLARDGSGDPVYHMSDEGQLCFQSNDGEAVSADDPRIANYMKAIGTRRRQRFYGQGGVWDQVHDFIANPETDEPLPRAFLRRRPRLAAWLNGEDPSYRPTRAEYEFIYPAFIERRRRIKESGLRNSLPAPERRDDPKDAQAYAPEKVRGIFDVSASTLLKYAKQAKVKTPQKVGGRGHRYTHDDVLRIARELFQSAGSPDIRSIAKAWLADNEVHSEAAS